MTRTCGAAYRNPALLNARRREKQQGTLWQHRYWEHLLRDEADWRHHLDYLHGNPDKHGLVQAVADWPWSSFHRYAATGAYPVDWGGAAPMAEVGAGASGTNGGS